MWLGMYIYTIIGYLELNNMKLILIISLICINGLVPAQAYESITADLKLGLLPVESAKRAHKNNETSQNTVQQFFDNDIDIVKAVQTVAKEWSSCEDTYAAVKKGVQISPNRADEIVAAIANIKGCSCNAQSFWARSRIQNRLRPRIKRALVEITSQCSCASAGIEAAIEVVPDQTEDMIDAVLIAKNRAANTTDSIGQIGVIPNNRYWGSTQVKTKDTNLIRSTPICKGDSNEHDEYEPEKSWWSNNNPSTNSVFQANKKLGYHEFICKDEDKNEEENEEDITKDKIIISQYIEGQTNDQALEIYNGSDKKIDLLLNNYQIELYFHGYEFPGEVIQLKGIIEPKSTFVIAEAKASSEILRATNQKVRGLTFKGADAIVLKSGINNNACECSISTVASAINGIDKENNEDLQQDEYTQKKIDFIKRIEQHYENTNVQSTIVDSIGQILINDHDKDMDDNHNNTQHDKPIVANKTLRRIKNICKGDRIEMDEFTLENEWQSYESDNFLDSGNYNEDECFATRKDLLLSEFVEGTEDNSMIELYNGTNRAIDFSTEKYYLEIYNDDDKNPDEEIYLKGKIDSDGVFVISHNDAEDRLKDTAQQITRELKLENARAVVLKKVVAPAYQACYADISDWLRKNKGKRLTYTLTPIRDPGTGPIYDDIPLDGDDGGELASPN